ncbi:hypothetical protein U1Q18_029443 [Sarracenia purpurea var. burkii]
MPTQIMDNSFFDMKQIDKFLLKQWNQKETRDEVVIAFHDLPWNFPEKAVVMVTKEELIEISIIIKEVEIQKQGGDR